ncbi:MAG TPA: hypothetical protein VLK30_00365 [Candidatus Limnocylindrales bacterium]|nr:hypothetical protein [Candidatus Limnocylindrales bacterium]
MALVAIGIWDYLQPVPAVAATGVGPVQYVVPGTAPGLPWPGLGSAAVGASDLGLIAASGDVAPTPAASVAKVMTALVVLDDKPLALGATGPTLIITDQDVATYLADAAGQQSVVPVSAGERLSEYEALEALLIPSGNNIAETLARWDAGSLSAFVGKMNQRAAALHLSHTTFAEPAGVSVQTVSTPSDLVAIGIAAMQQDVLAQIVNRPQATLPVAGTVYNVNSALGQSGIIGIKTGSGLSLGANFLFAAAATIDGQSLTLFGCVMGQPTLDAAFKAAEDLIAGMKAALRVRKVVGRGGVVGEYRTPWGSRVDLVSTTDVTLVEWPGMTVRQTLDAPTLAVDAPVAGGSSAGKLHIVLGDQQVDVPLVTAGSLEPPGITWRLWRISLL